MAPNAGWLTELSWGLTVSPAGVIGLFAAMLTSPVCHTLADGTMVWAGGSIAGRAGGCDGSAVGGGLGDAAGARRAWDGLRGGAGEPVSGYSAEGQQGGVRLYGHGAGDVQPVDLSAAGESGVLVAGAA